MRKCEKIYGSDFLHFGGGLLTDSQSYNKEVEDNSNKRDVRFVIPMRDYKSIFPESEDVEWTHRRASKHRIGCDFANLNIAFDIETYSFKIGNKKVNTMYCWQISCNFMVYIGRTWDEFMEMIMWLVERYNLGEYRRLIFWVHNLSYESAYLLNKMFFNVSAREKRKVMKMDCDMFGIEFRCTYMLSGTGLATVAKNLTKHRVRKTKERFDYTKARGTTTTLTKDEIRYCTNDVIIVNAYVAEQIELYGDMLHIPLTNTGRVRDYCKKNLSKAYKCNVQKLKISGNEELRLIQDAFSGGFTAGNRYFADETIEGPIHSADLTSAYPAVMIYEDKFPMSCGHKIKMTQEILDNSEHEKKCYIFKIRIHNLRTKKRGSYATPISLSKCHNYDEGDMILNNGKIERCVGSFEIAITDVDYRNYKKFYDWDKVEFGTAYEYASDYLPAEFRKCILHFFINKTYYKNEVKRLKKAGASYEEIANAMVQLAINKGMLNSCYGMCAQKLIGTLIMYTIGEGWDEEEIDMSTVIDEYNDGKDGFNSRFLFYAWAPFITALVRKCIMNIIAGVGRDFCYSDTDSVKYIHPERHENLINEFNAWVWKKLNAAADSMDLTDEERKYLLPHNEDGSFRPGETLGMFDDDGYYKRFKHLGAKRYIYEDYGGEIHVTVAGVQKTGFEKMLRIARRNYQDPFELFKDGLYIPTEYTGKQTAYYIDEEQEGEFVDYLGNVQHYHEHGAIYMEPCDYTLGLSDEYDWIIHGDIENFLM